MLGEPPLSQISRLPAVDHHNERRCPQTASALFWRGEGRSGPKPEDNGNEGRQNNLVIGPGSNPVHTRSSGANQKGTSTQQHVLRRERGRERASCRLPIPLRSFKPTSRPWPPNASTTPMGARHDEAVSPLSSAIAGAARGGSAVAAQGAHLRRGQSALIQNSITIEDINGICFDGRASAVNVRNHIHQINDALAGTDFEIRGGEPGMVGYFHIVKRHWSAVP